MHKCHRVAPGYAADLFVPILDRGRNAKRKGDRLLDHVQCARKKHPIVHCTVYMCRPNFDKLLFLLTKVEFHSFKCNKRTIGILSVII